jgi:anaerobic dimethyl sulfoxide reductase subunit A
MHSKNRMRRCTPVTRSKRRSLLKWGAALGGVAALTGGGVFFGLKPVNGSPGKKEELFWTSCTVNCASRCLLRAHVVDGVITRIETDNTGTDVYGQHQDRACLRGRSMRHRIYARTAQVSDEASGQAR